jgi:alpha-1,2-mannosyltransferase
MLREDRVKRWAVAACLLQALVLAVMIAGTHGWLVSGVKPNSTDYVSFYAAGRLADQGRPALAYDKAAHLAAEEAVTERGIGYQYFFNPPPFLLVMGPFAALPYLASFLLFQLLTLPLWLAVGTRIAGGGAVAMLCLMAVPSAWWVLGLGQNSFLSASLLGGGLLLLPHRKVAAGVLFGLLCYKPHLGLLIPVALLAAGEWAVMAAAGVTVAVCVGLTVLLFGEASWTAFLHMAQQSVGGAMDNGRVLLAGRVDPTGALQELGVPVHAARLIWMVCAAGAIACVALVWRRGSLELRNAVLAASVLIAVPFALFYDLILCSLAACWLVRAGRRDGFLPGEGWALVALMVATLLAGARFVAATGIPFGALVGPALLGLAMRRWWLDADGRPQEAVEN